MFLDRISLRLLSFFLDSVLSFWLLLTICLWFSFALNNNNILLEGYFWVNNLWFLILYYNRYFGTLVAWCFCLITNYSICAIILIMRCIMRNFPWKCDSSSFLRARFRVRLANSPLFDFRSIIIFSLRNPLVFSLCLLLTLNYFTILVTEFRLFF